MRGCGNESKSEEKNVMHFVLHIIPNDQSCSHHVMKCENSSDEVSKNAVLPRYVHFVVKRKMVPLKKEP